MAAVKAGEQTIATLTAKIEALTAKASKRPSWNDDAARSHDAPEDLPAHDWRIPYLGFEATTLAFGASRDGEITIANPVRRLASLLTLPRYCTAIKRDADAADAAGALAICVGDRHDGAGPKLVGYIYSEGDLGAIWARDDSGDDD
jgi:hypothetical protein